MDGNYDQGQQYPLESIQFVPGATGDKLIVRDGATDGAIIYRCLAPATLNGDMFVKYFNGANHRPFILLSECTLSSGHMVIIERR